MLLLSAAASRSLLSAATELLSDAFSVMNFTRQEKQLNRYHKDMILHHATS